MKSQNGNILFIILIAVILFAALSYAVTQSSRSGGGNISEEDASLQVAQIMSDLAIYQQAIQRLKIIGNYDEVYFDDRAPDESDTCYDGATVKSPCRTIGIFNPDEGIAGRPLTLPEWAHPSQDFTVWYWYSHHIREDGEDIGSPDYPEKVLWVEPLPYEVCKALNSRMNGFDGVYAGSDITSYTAANRGEINVNWRKSAGFSTRVDGGFTTAGEDFPVASGCFDWGSDWYSLQYVLEEH
ncbi:MAG: hypothetical protein CMH28_10695 [Micavibrio sp.]|nr:hypothetical protein [Micavibrio sp.]|tara:strand:+ start:393 stop:1112 length:720 start_codon:yes stop_codon:yes gene_type:complete